MTDPSPEWLPPPSKVTRPDQLPIEAWRAFDLIEGELVLQAWRSPPKGFLVLTNLRCFSLRQEMGLFPPHPWHVGIDFFFYNLRPPRVLLGRFLELSEEFQEAGAVGRFPVHNPSAVAATISGALGPGRLEWQNRRHRVEELMRARQRVRAMHAAGVALPLPKVRCSFCGNLADANSRRCPSCGASLI